MNEDSRKDPSASYPALDRGEPGIDEMKRGDLGAVRVPHEGC